MPRFSAQLTKDLYYGDRIQPLPRDLILTPQIWSGSDRGGCKQATLQATGSAESLASLCGWLGDKVEIFNEYGDCLWWGDLWDIELALGNIVIHLSLDDVRNRIRVTWPTILADGSEQSNDTDWAEDADSIARYGTRELVYGSNRGDSNVAYYMRDTILKRMSIPSPVISTTDESEYSATLTAQGSWYKADAVYFENLDGLEEHSDQDGSQILGQYMTSNQISFGGAGLDEETGELSIAGGGTFAPLQVDDSFTVSGSSGVNNQDFVIEKMDHPYQIGVSGTLTPVAAGPLIRISVGEGIAADGIAMRFSVDTPWTMTRVAAVMRKIGSPTDLVRVEIDTDVAGHPGTFLCGADFSGASMYTELTWTEFALPPFDLVAHTSYWLYIHRMGAASMTDGYEVAVDEGLGYVQGETPGTPVANARVLIAGAWVQRDPVCDMPFRIIGEIQSSEQLLHALGMVDSYSRNLVQIDSGIMVRQYSVATRTVMDEITELLDMGNTSGDRLIAWVTRDRTTVVDVAPVASEEEFVIGVDGRVRYPNGSNVAPGKLVYGQTVGIDSILLLDGMGVRKEAGAAVYVVESSYSADNDRLTVMGEGAPDVWSALKIVRG